MKSLLKLKDVAKLLDCSLSNVYALVSEGKLPVLKVGLKKGLRVDEADFLAYLAKVRHEGAGPSPPGTTPQHQQSLRNICYSSRGLSSRPLPRLVPR